MYVAGLFGTDWSSGRVSATCRSLLVHHRPLGAYPSGTRVTPLLIKQKKKKSKQNFFKKSIRNTKKTSSHRINFLKKKTHNANIFKYISIRIYLVSLNNNSSLYVSVCTQLYNIFFLRDISYIHNIILYKKHAVFTDDLAQNCRISPH